MGNHKLANLLRITGFLIGLFLTHKSFSQDDKIINYLQNDFKINHQVWGISKNPDNGMVYFATTLGLVEFDGLTFYTWENSGQKMLRSIFADSSGRVFTGGFESFGYWVPNEEGNMQYHSLSDSVVMNKNDEIWKIYASGNSIYFQSFTTVYKFTGGQVISFSFPKFMLFMFHVADEFFVQVLEDGLYTFNNDTFSLVKGTESFRQKKIHAIIPFINNQTLICTEKNGLFIKNSQGFTYWDCEASEFLKTKNCNCAVTVSDSLYAFGTILDGLIITNGNGKIIEHYNYSNGLNNNSVLALYTNQKRELWVGLDEGANYLNLDNRVTYYSASAGSLGSLYTILVDGANLYLGSNHGLFKTEFNQTGSSLHFKNLTMVPNSQGQVWTLGLFNNQILCGHNEGTFLVKPQAFEKISTVTGGWIIKPFEDKLIEGTYTGLISFNKDASGNWKFNKRIEGFYEPTRHLEIDYLGYIWVSHPQKGIFRLQPNENFDSIVEAIPFTELKNSIGLTDVYKLNNRVVFSTGKEFYTFDYVNNSMVSFTILNNALGEFRQSSQIIPNEKNQYWFVYQNRLALYRISIDFEPTKLGEFLITDANMPGQDITILPVNSSQFMVTNRNGLAVLKSAGNQPHTNESSLFVKNMFFQGKNENLTLCPGKKPIEVPDYLNNVRFNFAHPNALKQTVLNYQYRITEFEDNWNTTQTAWFQYYHLKPGTYHIQLKADSQPEIIEYPFTINPPWFRTIWAFVIYYLLLVVIIWLIIRYFKTKLLKQRQLLEFEVKQTSLENRLQNTNVELMLTLRYLIQKNESLQNLRMELEAIKNEPGNIPSKFVKKLDTHITQGLELQTKEWKMALHNLKLSQEGYFKMLKEKYPKLTNNDIRLCSYLRMNFSSKEIAHLLNISTRAVEISRYRLRKKLNLEHDKSLTDFLIQDEI